ncbi:P4H4, partial [Symbiodinium microadriaticum]
MRDFRDHVEILLALPYVDALLQDTQVRIAARVKEKRLQKAGHSQAWRHLPAKWQLFDTDRREVRTMSDILPSAGRPRFVLVFEGGAFVYPGIDLGFTRTIAVSDGQLDLVTLSMRPLVISIDGFLRAAEYDQIVSLMDKDKGREAAEFRTSQLLFMDSDRYSFLRAIDSRVANLTGQPTSHQEQVQVLKYEVGQYYLPHLDYWEPSFYQDPQVVQMTEAGHKNRLCTVFWYLSDCDGGYTAFPDAPIQQNGVSQVLYESDDEQARGRPYVTNTREVSQLEGTLTCPYGLRVPPHKGKAILFYSLLPNGQGDYMSSHSACAVTAGTKWAANKWVWNKRR